MLKLKKFIYKIDNWETNEIKKLDNYLNPVEEDDNIYTDIYISLSYEFITFNYDSEILKSLKRSDWMNLLNRSGFEINSVDKYGSHCDAGYVTITNVDNKYLLFSYYTATSGDVKIKISIDKCKNAIEEIASKY